MLAERVGGKFVTASSGPPSTWRPLSSGSTLPRHTAARPEPSEPYTGGSSEAVIVVAGAGRGVTRGAAGTLAKEPPLSDKQKGMLAEIKSLLFAKD